MSGGSRISLVVPCRSRSHRRWWTVRREEVRLEGGQRRSAMFGCYAGRELALDY
ncbi:hypothetical protein BN903_29 [Halorubrum sp. AJ67]|nr:hypothetical protein BN903_29 [Halorubrum sp. AJ67]